MAVLTPVLGEVGANIVVLAGLGLWVVLFFWRRWAKRHPEGIEGTWVGGWRRRGGQAIDRHRPICAICSQIYRRNHGCHIWAFTRRGDRLPGGGFMTHAGVPKQWQWNGWVRDRRGALWGCTHNHWKQRDALSCGVDYMRRMQLAKVVGAEVTPPYPVSLRPQRAPIRDLTPAAWAAMQAKHGHRCYYCGEPSRVFHREHKIPLARGGANNAANIAPACALCNLRKGILTDEEFFEQTRREAEREASVGDRYRASAARRR